MDLLQQNSLPPQNTFSLSFFTRKQFTHFSLLFFFLLILVTCFVIFIPSNLLNTIAFFSLILPKNQYYSTTSTSTIDIDKLKTCDLSNGEWVRDESYYGRLYTEECPFLDPGFRCRRNGRLDVDYLNWRWQPKECDLPRYVYMYFANASS